MTKELQRTLTDLENLLAIQRTFAVDTDKAGDSSADYHAGLYNGLAISHACITGDSPDYFSRKNGRPKKRETNIRHKGKK